MKLTQEQADALLAASKRPGRGAYMYMINASNSLMAQLMAQRKSALGIPQQFQASRPDACRSDGVVAEL